MSALTICTIAAKNYLSHARCLTDSFLLHHPEGRVFLLLADEVDGYFEPERERFTLITVRELNIPDFEQMAFRYTILELCTALKPFLLDYLFRRFDLQTLLYVDPDICFYSPDRHIQKLLQTQQIVLTPHLLSPYADDDPMEDESFILRPGIYNLGFIGLAQGEQTQRFLQWWKKRTSKDCVVDLPRGVFVDQRWVDLAPGFFESVAILRDEGYNAAFWALSHRRVHWTHDHWQVNDKPLVFFHFSGVEVHNPTGLSKHQERYSLDMFPLVKPLFEDYRARNLAHNYEAVRRWPYAYNYFDNGLPITDVMRYAWRDHYGETRWPQPFRTQGDDSFFNWLNRPAYHAGTQEPLVTHLAFEMNRRRPDWRDTFSDPLQTHRKEYARHFVREMVLHSQLPLAFVQPMRESLETFIQEQPAAKWRRIYYLIRNFLRHLRLHEFVKMVIGQHTAEAIYLRWVIPTDITHLYD